MATAENVKCVRSDAKKNDEKLLCAAKEIFLSKGIDASLEEIAKSAGVGIGTLYRHFPTRQQLVEAVLREGFHAVGKKGDELTEADDPKEALFTWLQLIVENATAYRGLAKSMAIALCNPEVKSSSDCSRLRDVTEHLLQRCQQAGDVRTDVTVDDLLMMLNALAWTTEQTSQAKFDTLLSVLLNGLSTKA